MGPFVMGPLVMGPYVGTPHIYLSPQIVSTCHLMSVQGEGGIRSPYMFSPRISLIGTLLYVQSCPLGHHMYDKIFFIPVGHE